MDVPDSIRREFAAAGWKTDRQVSVDPHVCQEHPAFSILQNFGGLHVGIIGNGVECGKSDIEFGWIDLAEHWPLFDWPELSTLELVGIAEVHHRHSISAIDRSGRCFGIFEDGLCFEGQTWREAFERLLLGYRSRPILLPGQEEVMLYGDSFAQGHADLFSLDV